MLLAHFSEWGMHMSIQNIVGYALLGLMCFVSWGSLSAEVTPAAVCITYNDTVLKTISSDAANKQYTVNIGADQMNGAYASLCFHQGEQQKLNEIKSQLVINNTLGVPLLIENLSVTQTVTPSQCVVGAATCPSIILKGSPIILRNLKVTNTNSQNPVDGVEVRTSQVTIENATVENFRYGLVVPESAGANQLTITKGVFSRTNALTGIAAGIIIKSGHGQTITDVTVHCAETGLALTGGTSDAPNVVRGGTFSGKNAQGESCTAHAGLFLQGGYVSATGTTEHPLTIADYQQGVVLDPVGPMGIDGGKISNAKVGIEIRNAVPPILPLLALQPKEFFNVEKPYDWKGEVVADSASIVMGKRCLTTVKQGIDGVEYDLCAVEETSNRVKVIKGILPEDFCTSEENFALLYTFDNVVEADDGLKTLKSKCDISPFLADVTFVQTQPDLKVVTASKGQCGFHCTEDIDGDGPLNISLALDMAEIVLVTDQGLLSLPSFQLTALNDVIATPGVAMATPIGGAPGVTGDGNDGGVLDQLTGSGEGTNLGEGDLGGGNNENAGGAGNLPGTAHAPFDDETIVPHDGTLDGRGSQIIAGGNLDGGGSSEGAPGGVAGVGAAGCSLMLGR